MSSQTLPLNPKYDLGVSNWSLLLYGNVAEIKPCPETYKKPVYSKEIKPCPETYKKPVYSKEIKPCSETYKKPVYSKKNGSDY